MSALPERNAVLVKTASQITKLRTTYRLLDFLQAPFGFVFWLIEQRKARLQDRIDNERSGL